MKVIVGFESSGVVREAFRKLGHDAWSCDLQAADDGSPFHIQGDVFGVDLTGFDLGIFHPPCTYLCGSGLHWNGRRPGRAQKTVEALETVRRIMRFPIGRLAIENPVGIIGTEIREADQKIQPHEFGDDASKGTCLWLKNLPPLEMTKYFPPRIVKTENPVACELGFEVIERRELPRWSNQTDSGQNKLGPSATRWKERSKTYAGIAAAMAEQWGPLGPWVDAQAALL